MTIHQFTDYVCRIALDPDEWPGEWESLLPKFPTLRRSSFTEGQKEVTQLVLGNDSHSELAFFNAVFTSGLSAPNGGLVFTETIGKEIFRTNWELHEVWDWQYVLDKLKGGQAFKQLFSRSGLLLEFCPVGEDILVQHVDYEYPGGLEASRLALQGAMMRDTTAFMLSVESALAYTRSLKRLAADTGSNEGFEHAFGKSP